MNWHDERERLLFDTITFVQQVTGESLVLAVKLKLPLSPELEAAARHLRRYHTQPKPRQVTELRAELGSLCEVFDNMQRVLRRSGPVNDRPAAALA